MKKPDPSKERYCYLQARPKTDDGYLEKMAKTVFRSGFNWDVIERKWPDFQEAFRDFSVEKVARFNQKDLDRLMNNEKIVRNRKKIEATIENAKKIQTIGKEHGSFRMYVKRIGKEGEEATCKTIVKEFSHIGDSMVVSFLRSVGEEVPEMTQRWRKAHGME